nr:unnamed protein product [Callosobruchus analis]
MQNEEDLEKIVTSMVDGHSDDLENLTNVGKAGSTSGNPCQEESENQNPDQSKAVNEFMEIVGNSNMPSNGIKDGELTQGNKRIFKDREESHKMIKIQATKMLCESNKVFAHFKKRAAFVLTSNPVDFSAPKEGWPLDGWRKIQQLGLASEYKNQQSPIGNWLNHLFGLTFLPPAEVGECFAQDFMSDKPQDSKVDQFTDYLVDTYIDSDSKFPPEI